MTSEKQRVAYRKTQKKKKKIQTKFNTFRKRLSMFEHPIYLKIIFFTYCSPKEHFQANRTVK